MQSTHYMLWCLHVQLLIEQLDAHLIVFSPYLSLTQLLQSDPSLADLSQNAWAALNDSYRTDVALVYPPYLLAVASVYLASVICSRDLQAWMEGLAVDMNHVSRGGRLRAVGDLNWLTTGPSNASAGTGNLCMFRSTGVGNGFWQ
jgi:hypothetical protein